MDFMFVELLGLMTNESEIDTTKDAPTKVLLLSTPSCMYEAFVNTHFSV